MEFVERGDIKIGMLQKATGNVKITETINEIEMCVPDWCILFFSIHRILIQFSF